MKAVALEPGPELRPFVERFLIVEYHSGWSTTLLPGTGLVAAFRFKGQCLIEGANAPNALVTGIWDRSRTLIHSGRCSNVLAMFTPTGARAFLKEPLETLFNGTLPMDNEFRRSELDLVEEQLQEATHSQDRVQAVAEFLLARVEVRNADRAVEGAVEYLRRSRGRVRIERLAQIAGLSQSALERRFRRAVGTSPKKFAALVRLRHVVRLKRAGHSFTEIAHAAGYADQPHFIKDFRRITGQAPESFFSTATAFC